MKGFLMLGYNSANSGFIAAIKESWFTVKGFFMLGYNSANAGFIAAIITMPA